MNAMIVDTMTMEEVCSCVLKSVKANTDRISALIFHKQKDYRRIILNGNKDWYEFKPISFNADGLTYYICPTSKGKKEFKKHNVKIYVFIHFFYKGTNWYAQTLEKLTEVCLYCQHFFQRYIERHLKSDEPVTLAIVRQYFRETDGYVYCENRNNPKHKNCMYGTTSIGMCCGFMTKNYCNVWLTYIDKVTIEKGQKLEVYDRAKNLIIPIGLDKNGNNIYPFSYEPRPILV
jgi:hypothetical protein